jgi:hypothetical protein
MVNEPANDAPAGDNGVKRAPDLTGKGYTCP